MHEYDHTYNRTGEEHIRRIRMQRALVERIDEEQDERKKVQQKSAITIGASDDVYEQQADAVAEKIEKGENAAMLVSSQPAALQRKEAAGTLMAKGDDAQLQGTEQLQTQLNSSKGGGSPLDPQMQSELGQKMGADLSGVKIHTDQAAHDMREGINAKAFTYGQDIYFRQGSFDPRSDDGKALLIHELVHTQQQNGISRKIQRKETDTPAPTGGNMTFYIILDGTYGYDKYVPVAGKDENVKKSLYFSLAQVYNISYDMAAALFVNWTWEFRGYDSNDISNGKFRLHLKPSGYFRGLELVAGYTPAANDGEALSQSLHTLFEDPSQKALYEESSRDSFPAMKFGWTKRVYELLDDCSAAGIQQMKAAYIKRYKTDPAKRFDRIVQSNFAPSMLQAVAAGDPAFYINAIELILNGTAHDAGAVTAYAKDNKLVPAPMGMIYISYSDKNPATQLLVVGNEATYRLDIERSYNRIDWYVYHDPHVMDSYSKSSIAAPPEIEFMGSGTEVRHRFAIEGAHRIVAVVRDFVYNGKDQAGDEKTETYTVVQYVSPSVLELAHLQHNEDLNEQAGSNIHSDILTVENLAVQSRLDTVFTTQELKDRYKNAHNASVKLSEAIRDQNVRSISNQYNQASSPVWYSQEENWKNGLTPETTQTLFSAGNTGNATHDLDFTTVKNDLYVFMKAVSDWIDEKGQTEVKETSDRFVGRETTYKNKYLESDDIQNIRSSLIATSIAADTFNKDSYSQWVIVSQSYIGILGYADKFAAALLREQAESLDDGGKKDEADKKKTLALQLEKTGQLHAGMMDVYENHPDAITVSGIFYPLEQYPHPAKGIQDGNPARADDFDVDGLRIFFYLYKNEDGSKWVLRDINPDSKGANEVDALPGETQLNDTLRIQSLFGQLDSKLRFPKGMIYYTVPYNDPQTKEESAITGKIATTAPTTLADWLAGIGLAFALLSLPFSFIGAPVMAFALGITATGLNIASSVLTIEEYGEQGLLTNEVLMVNIASIVADLATLGAMKMGVLKEALKGTSLAKGASISFMYLKTFEIFAGTTNMLIGLDQIFNQLSEIDKMPGNDNMKTFARIRLLTSAFTMGALHIIGMKSDLADLQVESSGGSKFKAFSKDDSGQPFAVFQFTQEELLKRVGDAGTSNRTSLNHILSDKRIADAELDRLQQELSVFLYFGNPAEKDITDMVRQLETAHKEGKLMEQVNELSETNLTLVTFGNDQKNTALDLAANKATWRDLKDALGDVLSIKGLSNSVFSLPLMLMGSEVAEVAITAVLFNTFSRIGSTTFRLKKITTFEEYTNYLIGRKFILETDLQVPSTRKFLEDTWADATMTAGYSRAEIKDVKKYREKNPTSTLSNQEIVERFRQGQKMTAAGDFYNPNKTTRPDTPAEITPLGAMKSGAVSKEADRLIVTRQQEFELMNQQRQKAQKDRDAFVKGSQGYKDEQYRMQRASEKMGELAAEIYLLQKGYTKIWPPDGYMPGAGQFDQVWEFEGQLFIVEAKGGNNPELGTKITDTGKIAQQGSFEYMKTTIADMEDISLKQAQQNATAQQEAKNVAEKVKVGLLDNNVRYLYFNQKFDALGKPLPIEVSEFKITN